MKTDPKYLLFASLMLFNNVSRVPLLARTPYDVGFCMTVTVNLYFIILKYPFPLFYSPISVFDGPF
jgi:hypothetical protein